jgi:hypothetical protein
VTVPAPTLPPFLRTVAAHGELALSWEPFPARRAFVVAALREPESFGAEAFWSGAVDNDLIRIPVVAAEGRAVIFIPAGRPVALTLVARGADGALLPAPLLVAAPQHSDRDVLDCTDPNDDVATQHRDAPKLPGPVAHRAAPSRDTPFVFVADEAAPDLTALARRVAERATDGAAAPVVPARPRPSCFGTRQRWYLARLALPGAGAGPRLLVRRSTFMDADLVASWAAGPPEDAIAVAADADGLIDGVAAEDDTTFYVLLAGPAPFRPLPLMPVAPPFDAVRRPMTVGPAAERLDGAIAARLTALTAGAVALSELPPVLTLIRAAVAWLAPEHPVRSRAERAVAALETEPRY